MFATVMDHPVPDGEFVVRIDELLEKGVPDKAIPWQAQAAPGWARGFAPRLIVDLGSGVGGFVRSVLTRLGEWGCLGNLERVVLIESDKSLIAGGGDGLRDHLTSVIRDALAFSGKQATQVDVLVGPIELLKAEGQTDVIPTLEHYRNADLIIASHITYYFGDGSGRDLIRSLYERYRSETGRLWCVIRKRRCPIYEQRARTLFVLGVEDVKPLDYAEYFEASVLPSLHGVSVLAAEDNEYLSDTMLERRAEAAYLLMWREAPSPTHLATPYGKAVTSIVTEPAPLFVERHFILGRPQGEDQ